MDEFLANAMRCETIAYSGSIEKLGKMNSVTESRENLAFRALSALGALMEQMDRGDALGEATFAAMETVVFLVRAGDGVHSPDRLESLRQALGAARATVVAAGYTLTTAADAERMNK